MRLADVPVPRRAWWWVLLLLVLRRGNKRATRAAAKVGADLGESVVWRWEKTDASTDAMLRLTRTMVRLTWAVAVLTIVVLASTLWLGLR